MHVLYLFVLLVFLAPVRLAQAEQPGHEVQLLRSEAFARLSGDALFSGDRPSAIILALRGLPDDPDERDIDAFSEAYEALLRAVVSRSVRLPLKVEVSGVTGPLGRRMVTVGAVVHHPKHPEKYEPVRLWDTQSGRKIADLLPIEATHHWGGFGAYVVFSPDGHQVAVVANRTGEIVFFDAQTGREISRFRPYQTESYEYSAGLRFSSDGSLLMTAGNDPASIDIWDVASGARVFGETDEPGCVYIPVAGGPGSDLYYLKAGLTLYMSSGVQTVCNARLDLVRVRKGRAELLLDLSGLGAGADVETSIIDPGGTRLLMRTPTGTLHVISLDGTLVSSLSPEKIGGGYFTFARNGEAISAPGKMWETVPRTIRLFDLHGNPLEPTVEDHLPYLHGVFTSEGHSMGGLFDLSSRSSGPEATYAGQDLPRGKELYDMVWQNLPAHVRQQVNEDRVSRP